MSVKAIVNLCPAIRKLPLLKTFALAMFVFTLQGQGVSQIIINEIMQNPSAVADGSGEWFEVFNPTGSAIDINGWTIRDNDFDSHVVANGGPLLAPAGGFLVLGLNSDSGTNGGVSVDYEYVGVALANGADELVLLDTVLGEVDRVEWDGGPTFPDPTGASMSLVNPSFDNNVGSKLVRGLDAFRRRRPRNSRNDQ
jgi:hypothetical protein